MGRNGHILGYLQETDDSIICSQHFASGKWSSNSTDEDYVPRKFPHPEPIPPPVTTSQSESTLPIPSIEDARALFDKASLASMDERTFQALTGVTKSTFRSFFGGTRARLTGTLDGNNNKVSQINRLLLFLVKLNMGLDFQTLANLLKVKGEYLFHTDFKQGLQRFDLLP